MDLITVHACIVCGGMFVLILLAVYKSTTKKVKRICCEAEIIEKNIWHHHPSSTGTPLVEKEYWVTFLLENGKQRSFDVGEILYPCLSKGSKDTLTYQGDKIISFGTIIKEFY